MFSFGRRDEISPTHQQQTMPKTPSKRNSKFRGKMTKNRNTPPSLNVKEMNVKETHSGIEVSLERFHPGSPAVLDHNTSSNHNKIQPPESREPVQSLNRPIEPVISVKEQIRQRQKVCRNQFSTNFPALKSKQEMSLEKWRPKDHRIPLMGYSAVDMAYQDVLNLLQQVKVVDEYTSVKDEISAMDNEIGALEKDRDWLETSYRKMESLHSAISNSFSFNKGDPNAAPPGSGPVHWDASKLLDDPNSALSAEERQRLQKQRGNCLTIHFMNPRAKEVFLSKCHASTSKLNANAKRKSPGGVVTLGPNNCRPDGAATTMRNLSLMTNNQGSHLGFFMSRDGNSMKSQCWGRLPPKLFRRIQEEGVEIGNLVYLSTGPHGCYYAEFRSGECWWGSAVEDRDFHTIVQSWDVHRVVFGPIEEMETDDRGSRKVTNAWIILGRDGRAAWKNLPSRLHNRLESRLANWAAPAEVALGPGDSYFVRFLDGTVDYFLPAQVARVCDYIEKNGGTITDISLHPEISHDFVIRHTEFQKPI